MGSRKKLAERRIEEEETARYGNLDEKPKFIILNFASPQQPKHKAKRKRKDSRK